MPPLLAGTAQGWPRLPALEWLLARAERTRLAQRDWRGWLAPRATVAGVVAAALALQQARLPDSLRQYWLATPVHWTAGLDTVRLHPQGLLQLGADEAGQLTDDFARVFAGSGWELAACDGRELLLSGAQLAVCEADDPALWRGQSPRAGLVRGADASVMRRLGAEMEMWLHDHPVNRRRQAAGAATISALWLWGQGPAAAAVPATGLGLLLAQDLYARSWWRLCGAPVQGLPERWAGGDRTAWPATVSRQTVVVPWSGEHPAAVAQQLEEQWILPLLADWRARHFGALCLIAGRDRFQLTSGARWRAWRRRHPWWESLLA